MLHDLIKQATINLAPEAEEPKDWFGFGDPIAYEDDEDEEDEDEDEDDNYEDEDEDEEEEEWEECDCEDDNASEFSLNTTKEKIEYYYSMSIQDSEVLKKFVEEVIKELDISDILDFWIESELFSTPIYDLDFLNIEVFDDDSILFTVYTDLLLNYINN